MPLTGRWRIVEMEMWDRDAIDLVGPGFIEFAEDGSGQFGFIAVRGWMDCRTTERGLSVVRSGEGRAGTMGWKQASTEVVHQGAFVSLHRDSVVRPVL
ncbi:hypothetical protein [Streptomyces sp. 6N223]|uniref:hypothetical protein n=1 Tax=Streptomyces sp. 6N223 TaxID=3457412 RepID=UPI003FD5B103